MYCLSLGFATKLHQFGNLLLTDVQDSALSNPRTLKRFGMPTAFRMTFICHHSTSQYVVIVLKVRSWSDPDSDLVFFFS